MADETALGELTEEQFSVFVDSLTSHPNQHEQLIDLFREDHSVYRERSAPEVVRMRGWLLIGLAKRGISDADLRFVVEELESGTDAYLVAAAAFALRTSSGPRAVLAPLVMRAISNIRFHDSPVCLTEYGEYVPGAATTTAVRELLSTLTWLGREAAGIEAEVRALLAVPGGLPEKHEEAVRLALTAMSSGNCDQAVDSCCEVPSAIGFVTSWISSLRGGTASLEDVRFQDEHSTEFAFRDFFQGRPTVVVFFYTRCDNPLKCSLTVSKLAQVQSQLRDRGVFDQIQTVAITYDPDYDSPPRLLSYARDRGFLIAPAHRMLRATSGVKSLKQFFQLKVGYVDSLVNRHQIELFILDQEGRIATSFRRLSWSIQEVTDRAIEVLHEPCESTSNPSSPVIRSLASPLMSTLSTIAVALFPKCPMCWAAYMSVFGIAGLEQIPLRPWFLPVLVVLMLINAGCLWSRTRTTGRWLAFLIVVLGMLGVLIPRFWVDGSAVTPWGISATLLGVLWGVLPSRRSAQTGPLPI